VPIHRLSAPELRVLGCLIEKQRTTPEQYPLSLNALRLACNQSTNREPVVDYDEATVHDAAQRLGRVGWARLASGPGSRVAKYRQLVDEDLGLVPSETAVLGLLMLRGPQTAAELNARSERLHRFASTDDVSATLARLAERELVALQPRRPGQREERWVHLLSSDEPNDASTDGPESAQTPPAASSALEERLARIEARLDELERALTD
jgi:uncharacterized protein YceH (UPF0502 family)